jgi:tetratricopeptide (TPR) repeat protein
MKKIPLRIYFVAGMGLLLLVLSILLTRRLIVNHNFVSAYNKGDYSSEQENTLLKMNFPESFVPYYNLGNVAYKYGDYNSAISYYTSALENYPPEGKDCKIRINLALAMCNTIDFNHLDSQEKIDTALFILYKARDVLLEKGCAVNEEGQVGHDADAQQLKEDIDRMIEKLENPDQKPKEQEQQEDDNSNGDEGSSGSDTQPSDREKKIQGELENKKKDALEDRKDQQDSLERWSDYVGGGNGEEDGEGGEGGSESITSPW